MKNSFFPLSFRRAESQLSPVSWANISHTGRVLAFKNAWQRTARKAVSYIKMFPECWQGCTSWTIPAVKSYYRTLTLPRIIVLVTIITIIKQGKSP